MGGELTKEKTRRCPICEHLSDVWYQDAHGLFFICKNYQCKVSRIYDGGAVMLLAHDNLLVRKKSQPENGDVGE
jgi:hypothetical protein